MKSFAISVVFFVLISCSNQLKTDLQEIQKLNNQVSAEDNWAYHCNNADSLDVNKYMFTTGKYYFLYTMKEVWVRV